MQVFLKIPYKILTLLIVIVILSTGLCTDDSFYKTIVDENIPETELAHKTYFEIPDTGQTTGYTVTYGEDNDYSTPTPPSYTDNSDGTIIDMVTQLKWTKCSMNVAGNMDNTLDCSGSHQKYSHSDAISACSNLVYAGYEDWRLPTFPEMFSIIDFGQINTGTNKPSINESLFPNTEFDINNVSDDLTTMNSSEQYWTSTSWFFFGEALYFRVNFDNGLSSVGSASEQYFVRCVRGPK